MATALYSISHVHGAEVLAVFLLLGAGGYYGCCMLIKRNRTRRGRRNVLLGLLAAEVVMDLLWALIYYHNGTYHNYGIGAVFGFLLWIPALVVAGIAATYGNR